MNVAEVHLGKTVTRTGQEQENNVKLNKKELLSVLTEGNYQILIQRRFLTHFLMGDAIFSQGLFTSIELNPED